MNLYDGTSACNKERWPPGHRTGWMAGGGFPGVPFGFSMRKPPESPSASAGKASRSLLRRRVRRSLHAPRSALRKERWLPGHRSGWMAGGGFPGVPFGFSMRKPPESPSASAGKASRSLLRRRVRRSLHAPRSALRKERWLPGHRSGWMAGGGFLIIPFGFPRRKPPETHPHRQAEPAAPCCAGAFYNGKSPGRDSSFLRSSACISLSFSWYSGFLARLCCSPGSVARL